MKNMARWEFRRYVVALSLCACWLLIGYSVIGPVDTELARSVVATLSTLAGSIIGSYVFGAVWDNKGTPK